MHGRSVVDFMLGGAPPGMGNLWEMHPGVAGPKGVGQTATSLTPRRGVRSLSPHSGRDGMRGPTPTGCSIVLPRKSGREALKEVGHVQGYYRIQVHGRVRRVG